MTKATPGKRVEDMIELLGYEDHFVQDIKKMVWVLSSEVRWFPALMSCAYR